jgi:hypothetical protein
MAPAEQQQLTTQDIKSIRISEWKGMVEQEIQKLMEEAAQLRKTINVSKTDTKKQFYTKKFKKISAETIKMVEALQTLTIQEETSLQHADTTTQA